MEWKTLGRHWLALAGWGWVCLPIILGGLGAGWTRRNNAPESLEELPGGGPESGVTGLRRRH